MKTSAVMNICFVSSSYPISGKDSEKGFLLPLTRKLTQLGHQVTVLAWRNNQEKDFLIEEGISVYYLGEKTQLGAQHFKYQAYNQFKKLNELKPFDIVHSIDNNGILIGIDKKFLKIKIIYDIDATRLSQIFSIIGLSNETVSSKIRTAFTASYLFLKTYFGGDKKVLQTADAVIVHSHQQRLALERHYLYPEKKTHIIPYSIEVGDLSPREKSLEMKKKLGLTPDAQTIVTFTDMTELSLIEKILLAFESIALKNSSARLVIVGDGPLRKKIEFKVFYLALGSRVIFAGKVKPSEVSDLLACADVLVSLSSKSSGFEPRILEAMAQKKIVIGSEVNPIANLIENGKNGFLIRPADQKALFDLFTQIFNGNIDKLKIGEEARKTVLDIINLDTMLEALLKVYKNCCFPSLKKEIKRHY